MKNTIPLLALTTLAFASGCVFVNEKTTTPQSEKSAPKTAACATTAQTDDAFKNDRLKLEKGLWFLVGEYKGFPPVFGKMAVNNPNFRIFFIGNQILVCGEDPDIVIFDGTYSLRVGKDANEIVIKDSLGKKPDIVGTYRIKTDGSNFSLSFPSLQKPDSDTPMTFLFNQ